MLVVVEADADELKMTCVEEKVRFFPHSRYMEL